MASHQNRQTASLGKRFLIKKFIKLNGFVCAFHPAASGLNIKHTITLRKMVVLLLKILFFNK